MDEVAMDGFGAIAMKRPVTYDRSNRDSSPTPNYGRALASVPQAVPDTRTAEAVPEKDGDVDGHSGPDEKRDLDDQKLGSVSSR
jgi:hypothetical protein